MTPSFVRRWTSLSRSLLGITALAASGCNSEASPPVGVCAAVYTPAVIAHVTDSVTGIALAQTATGVIRSGAMSDSLRFFAAPDEMAAGGSAGTYDVVVSHAGYADFTRANVLVTPSGFCSNVNTVTLQVRLVPTP